MPQGKPSAGHEPVLIEAVLKYLSPRVGESYLDLTAGYGGHAEAILAKTGSQARAVLVDRDQMAVDYLQKRFNRPGLEIRHQDFLTASEQLKTIGGQFDLILADLGISSPHLNMASRGFSIRQSGPLDMRMDQRQILTADTIVNTYDESELARILRQYGEEPKAAMIARLIVKHRPIKTTDELACIVAKAWPGQFRLHPATRSFQALRIAVNSELELLERSLPLWCDDLLADNGRIAVINFHSLEDRLVKAAFASRSQNTYDASLGLLTKKPVTSDSQEIVFNPRARSAKLRAAVKIKNKEREAT